MAEPARRIMTVDEFLDWAETQEIPYEFDGENPVPLYPSATGNPEEMMSGSIDHHLVQANAYRLIARAGDGGARSVMGASVRTRSNQLRIPDVVLFTGTPATGAREVPDPVLLVEVLSPSTKDVDCGTKLEEYRALPSVREVWLVDSTRRVVTCWLRRPDGWFVTDTIGRGSFRSDVLDAAIALDELYEGVEV
jgi:Uma2 family endonuclease